MKKKQVKNARPSKAEIQKILTEKHYKAIKKYVTFKYKRSKNFNKKQSRKIEKYFRHIDALLARPVTIYRTKSKKKMKLAKDFAGHDPKFKEIKVAFLPVTNHKVKVNVSKKGITVQATNMRVNYIVFDNKKLVKNPVKYIENKVNTEQPKAKYFKIRVGEQGIYEIKSGTWSKKSIGHAVQRYMLKYDQSKKHHYWKDWLHGVNAYYTRNQKNISNYRIARSKRAKDLSLSRAKKHRRENNALKNLGFKFKRYSHDIIKLKNA